jgi:hypothetical protein
MAGGVCRAQRRHQDEGLSAGALAQCPVRSDTQKNLGAGALGGAAPRSDRRGRPARTLSRSRQGSRSVHRAGAEPRRDRASAPASPTAWCTRSSRSSERASTSGAKPPWGQRSPEGHSGAIGASPSSIALSFSEEHVEDQAHLLYTETYMQTHKVMLCDANAGMISS